MKVNPLIALKIRWLERQYPTSDVVICESSTEDDVGAIIYHYGEDAEKYGEFSAVKLTAFTVISNVQQRSA